jgi:outer membrane protein TolC
MTRTNNEHTDCRDTRPVVGTTASRVNRRVRFRLLACGCLCSSIAAAQTPQPAAPDPAKPDSAIVAPASTTPTVEVPKEPTVNDPMLAPQPRPQRELASWHEAVTQLRARSIDLATAYAEVIKAEAQSRIALAALLPTINGTATATHQFITKETSVFSNATGATRVLSSPTNNVVNGGISLSQSLVDVKAWHDLGTAHAAEEIQRVGVQNVKRTMRLSLATAVVAVVTAERVSELNRIGLRSALQLLDLTKKKAGLGTATGLDLVRAEQSVSGARSSIVSGDESLRQAREALGLVLGEPQQVGVTSGIRIEDLVGNVSESCQPLKSPLERPELEAARQQLNVAERAIRSTELSFLPTLRAQSSVNTSSIDPGNSPRATWNIQAVLSVPIWDGGARYGTLRSARASRDEAAITIESKRRTITIEVEQARRSVQVAEQSVEVARKSAELAQRNDALTRIAFQLGKGTTSFELVAAAVALQQAQVQLAVQEFNLVNARIQALMTMARCTDAS